MIKSMTGYGNATGASGKLGLTVELRSVNNRFLDCNVRIPRVYTAAEDAIKAMVQSRISRGKVDVYVTIDASAADDVTIRINEPLAGAYVDAFQHLFDKYGVTNDLTASSLARFSDVLVVEKKETDTDQLTKDICAVLAQALDSFDSMRIAEGARLRDDILSRADEIERLTALAEARSPQTVAEYRARLDIKQSELAEKIGVRRETIIRLEKGLYNPSLKLAMDIAKFFGTTVEELFEFEE